MAWVFLLLSGLFEIGWAVGLKYADGFTRIGPTMATVIAYVMSLVFLGLAVKSLPLGTAYAIFTGIGTVGAAICGIILFGESASLSRLACIVLIVSGIVGLKVLTPQ